jgi:outer membrane protein TolC
MLLEDGRELEKAVAAGETGLNVAMGRDAFEPVGALEEGVVSDEDVPVERLKELMMENRPEVRSAEDKVAAARARLEGARRAWIPDPALTVVGQRYNGAGQGVSEVDAGISFNVPWANERKYAAGTREAASEVRAAEAELEARKVEGVGLLRGAVEDLVTARHHLHLSGETLLKQSEDALKASEIGYGAGKMGLGEWIEAARAEREVEGMRLDETRDYEVAVGEVEAVVGAMNKKAK